MRDYWSNKKSICLYNKHKGVLCHNRWVAADHEDRGMLPSITGPSSHN